MCVYERWQSVTNGTDGPTVGAMFNIHAANIMTAKTVPQKSLILIYKC